MLGRGERGLQYGIYSCKVLSRSMMQFGLLDSVLVYFHTAVQNYLRLDNL